MGNVRDNTGKVDGKPMARMSPRTIYETKANACSSGGNPTIGDRKETKEHGSVYAKFPKQELQRRKNEDHCRRSADFSEWWEDGEQKRVAIVNRKVTK